MTGFPVTWSNDIHCSIDTILTCKENIRKNTHWNSYPATLQGSRVRLVTLASVERENDISSIQEKVLQNLQYTDKLATEKHVLCPELARVIGVSQMRTKKEGKGLELGWGKACRVKRMTKRAQFPYASSLPLSSCSRSSLFSPIFSSSWLSLSSSLDNCWFFSFSWTKSCNSTNMISCCANGDVNYPALSFCCFGFLNVLKKSLDKMLVPRRSAKILQWQLSVELNWLLLFIVY